MREKVTILRYPGGKSWFLQYAEQLVSRRRPRVFVEPFAGGASVGLTLLARDRFDHLVMVERDHRVAAFWRRVLGDPSFAEEVEAFRCRRDNVEALLANMSETNLAMWTLVKNRCSFGGNLSAGLMSDVACRWNGPGLATMIRQVYGMRDRITFFEGDGVEVLRRYAGRKNVAAFADPPYTVRTRDAGFKLYRQAKLNHARLLAVLRRFRGDWMATYDGNPLVRTLAKVHGFAMRLVPMMTNCHERTEELVLSKSRTMLPTGPTRLRRLSTVSAMTDSTTGREAIIVDFGGP